jgi:hypothetical protein
MTWPGLPTAHRPGLHTNHRRLLPPGTRVSAARLDLERALAAGFRRGAAHSPRSRTPLGRPRSGSYSVASASATENRNRADTLTPTQRVRFVPHSSRERPGDVKK